MLQGPNTRVQAKRQLGRCCPPQAAQYTLVRKQARVYPTMFNSKALHVARGNTQGCCPLAAQVRMTAPQSCSGRDAATLAGGGSAAGPRGTSTTMLFCEAEASASRQGRFGADAGVRTTAPGGIGRVTPRLGGRHGGASSRTPRGGPPGPNGSDVPASVPPSGPQQEPPPSPAAAAQLPRCRRCPPCHAVSPQPAPDRTAAPRTRPARCSTACA